MPGYGQLTFNGQHGFLTCPSGADGAYDIKAIMGYVIPSGCTVVDLLVPEAGLVDGATTWQYT